MAELPHLRVRPSATRWVTRYKDWGRKLSVRLPLPTELLHCSSRYDRKGAHYERGILRTLNGHMAEGEKGSGFRRKGWQTMGKEIGEVVTVVPWITKKRGEKWDRREMMKGYESAACI